MHPLAPSSTDSSPGPTPLAAAGPCRVLFICHDGALYGSQHSLKLLVAHLPPERYHVFVSLARSGPLVEHLPPHVTVLRHQRLQWVKHDRRSPLQRLGDALGLLANLPLRVWRLAREIRRHGIEIVHSNSMVSLEGALAAKLAGVPHVWHLRELFMADSPKLQPVLGRPLTRWVIHSLSRRVVCISQAVRRQFGPLADQAPQRYPVIYNAVPTTAAPPPMAPVASTPSRAFRLGYIGRLSAGKRFQDLVAALAQLRASGADVTLNVAGSFVDAPFQAAIQEQIAAAGLEDAIRFWGYQTDLAPLHAEIDLLVVPSLNEPFGRVVIEAMAAEVPCLAADSGGIPEILTDGETGFLYPPTDVGALVAQIRRLMDDPQGLAAVKQRALASVAERFSVEAQISSLEALYQGLLSRQ